MPILTFDYEALGVVKGLGGGIAGCNQFVAQDRSLSKE